MTCLKAAKWHARTDTANVFGSRVQYTVWFHMEDCPIHLESTALGVEADCHLPWALEQGDAPEHQQYLSDIVVWGNTAEELFEKGKKNLAPSDPSHKTKQGQRNCTRDLVLGGRMPRCASHPYGCDQSDNSHVPTS